MSTTHTLEPIVFSYLEPTLLMLKTEAAKSYLLTAGNVSGLTPATTPILNNAIREALDLDRKSMKPTVYADYTYGDDVLPSQEFDTLVEALVFASRKRITGRIETPQATFTLKRGVVPKKRQSKKVLVALLLANGFIKDEKNVCYEAYGRDVHAYIGTTSQQSRKALEAFLRLIGMSTNPDYAPASNTVNTQVTYFKAWHWDE